MNETQEPDKNPLEALAELVLYAPIGAAALARDALPELFEQWVERGREEMSRTSEVVANQFEFARGVGQALVNQVLRRGGEPEQPDLGPMEATPPTPPSTDGEAAIRKAQSQAARAMQDAHDAHRSAVDQARAEAEVLPIPDYESLSAAQVNARLTALSQQDLEAVQRYEQSHRGRRTVLARVEALLS